MTELARAAAILVDAERVMITAHRRPDGDAVGSMLALAALLREQGKQVTLYNPDLIPRNLKWLPHAKSFVRRLRKSARFDATAVVDCGDRNLLGKNFPNGEVTGALIAFDHHSSCRPFGDVFVHDPAAASVGVLIARLAEHLGWPLNDAAAHGIFVSLVADTGSFRYSNANAEAFRIAAELVESGKVDPWAINERMYERVPLSRYRLLAAALGSLEVVADGKLAFITITAEMIQAAESSWEDSEGVVNYARALAGVECGVLITPAKEGGVRVSLRSKGRAIDAGAVCIPFGGGGHPGAAGCRIQAELADARRAIEEALVQALETAAAPAPSDSISA